MRSFLLFFIIFSNLKIVMAEDGLAILKNRLSGRIVGAHQGGLFSGHFPNTMDAFQAALNSGADIVEMDLHLSKDGIVVVYHDDDLDTWTNCKGPVREKNYEELKNCQFRLDHRAHIPRFEEVLQWSSGKIIVDAEFKDFESIKPALELVKKYNSYSWTYFQTQSNKEKFVEAHGYDPKVALLYAVNNSEELDWALDQDDELLIIELNNNSRSQAFIDKIHAKNKIVTEDAWHFSKLPKLQELFASACKKAFKSNIDIVISNRPKNCLRAK